MINYKKAKKILMKSKIRIKEELIDSSKSLNRINVFDVYCDVNYPAGTNAAFDGFAINSKDTIKINKNKDKINNICFLLLNHRSEFIFIQNCKTEVFSLCQFRTRIISGNDVVGFFADGARYFPPTRFNAVLGLRTGEGWQGAG